MTMKMKFIKIQGGGNDCIYVNTMHSAISNPVAVSRKRSRPHTGRGSGKGFDIGMAGGHLTIEITPEKHVLTTGPAVKVFDREI